MRDVDTLDGQALVDAVAVEVMGWVTLILHFRDVNDIPFCEEWWAEPHGQVRDVNDIPIREKRGWHPESSWSDFGAVWDKLAEEGHALTLCQSNVSGRATGIVSGSRLIRSSEVTRDGQVIPGEYEVGGGGCSEDKGAKAAFLRAALKAVRSKGATHA